MYIYLIIHRNPIETDSHFLSLNLIAAGGQSSSALTIQASCTDTTLTGMMFPIIVIVNYLLRKLCGYLRQSTSPPFQPHHIVNPLTTGNTHAKAKIVGSLGNLKLIAAVGATFWPAAAIALCIFMLLLKSFSFCTSSP